MFNIEKIKENLKLLESDKIKFELLYESYSNYLKGLLSNNRNDYFSIYSTHQTIEKHLRRIDIEIENVKKLIDLLTYSSTLSNSTENTSDKYSKSQSLKIKRLYLESFAIIIIEKRMIRSNKDHSFEFIPPLE